MSDPASVRGAMGVGDIERRFGLRVRTHRIGSMEIRVAEVEEVDRMVEEVYPDAVTLHGDAPVWMITWPAALALAEHVVLVVGPSGLRVLELGCGTAAPGIAAAMAGGRVTLTDYDPLPLEVARHNARLSGCRDVGFHLLDWFHPDLRGKYDLVLGSEIVYYEKHFPALLAVLARYVEPGGRILLADQGRPQVEGFLGMCRRAGLAASTAERVVHTQEGSRGIRIVELRPGP